MPYLLACCAISSVVGPGHRLGDVVPVRVLRRAEVRAVEDLLQPEDLHAAPAGFFDEREVHVDRRLADLLDRRGRIGQRRGRLNEAADDSSGIRILPSCEPQR